MQVAIIGIQGVGMAHAIACERVGFEVVSVLDTDPNAEDRLKGVWSNSWGKIHESVHPVSAPVFTTSAEQFKEIPADLLIIATPTEFHIPYLLLFGDRYPKILVEKPLSYSSQELARVPLDIQVKTWCGFEWLLHPLQPKMLGPSPFFLRFTHNQYPQQKHLRECGVLWDLGSHVFAQFLHHYNRADHWRDPDLHFGRMALHTIIHVSGGMQGVIEVGYLPFEEYRVNDICMEWTNLFDRQLKAMEGTSHPGTFNLAAKVTAYLERMTNG